jgi:hypothetical protein
MEVNNVHLFSSGWLDGWLTICFVYVRLPQRGDDDDDDEECSRSSFDHSLRHTVHCTANFSEIKHEIMIQTTSN